MTEFILTGAINWGTQPTATFSGSWQDRSATARKGQTFSYTESTAEACGLAAPEADGAGAAPGQSFWTGLFQVHVGHGRHKPYTDSFCINVPGLLGSGAAAAPETATGPLRISGRGCNQVGKYVIVDGEYDQASGSLSLTRVYEPKPLSPKPAVRTAGDAAAAAAGAPSPAASAPTPRLSSQPALRRQSSRMPRRVRTTDEELDQYLNGEGPAEAGGRGTEGGEGDGAAAGAGSGGGAGAGGSTAAGAGAGGEEEPARRLQREGSSGGATPHAGDGAGGEAKRATSVKRRASHGGGALDEGGHPEGSPTPTAGHVRSGGKKRPRPEPAAWGASGAGASAYTPRESSLSLTPSLAVAAASALALQAHGLLPGGGSWSGAAGAPPDPDNWVGPMLLGDDAGPLCGCLYEGEAADGAPHGYGTLVYASGSMYEGGFVRGRESGKGVLSDGDDVVLYQGDMADGAFNGNGTFYYGNGDRYTGQWRDGLYHGKGTFSSGGGASYVGEWVEGLRHGNGTMIDADNAMYQGTWVRGERAGRGDYSTLDGFKFKGTWAHDAPDGKGEVTFADGSRYDGSLRDGLREGRGTYFFLHGQQYSGRFSSDEIEGGAPGTVLMPHTVPLSADEWMIPVHVGADVSKLHAKAGFDKRGQ